MCDPEFVEVMNMRKPEDDRGQEYDCGGRGLG